MIREKRKEIIAIFQLDGKSKKNNFDFSLLCCPNRYYAYPIEGDKDWLLFPNSLPLLLVKKNGRKSHIKLDLKCKVLFDTIRSKVCKVKF